VQMGAFALFVLRLPRRWGSLSRKDFTAVAIHDAQGDRPIRPRVFAAVTIAADTSAASIGASFKVGAPRSTAAQTN
jgi:hypothetical protein